MTARRGESYYKVVDRIATGGMAEVFRGEALGLAEFQKTVAIKRVLPSLASNPRFVRMFLDEARLSARLDHKNIVQVFDVGRADDTYFIVMEYVEGVTLKAVLEHTRARGRTLAVPLAVHIAIEMLSGLGYAHELKDREGKPLGVVHRDISPTNVLIARSGGVKIVDFGVARAATQVEKTDPGVVKGKLHYLSPEAAQGAEVDARMDLYATGIVLWEMLSGRQLFHGKTDWETLQQVRAGEVPSLVPINPAVPPALDAVVQKALARELDARYPTAAAMSRALTRVLFEARLPVNSEDLGALVREVMDVASGGAAPLPGEGVNSVIGIAGQIFVPPDKPLEIESLVAPEGGGTSASTRPAAREEVAATLRPGPQAEAAAPPRRGRGGGLLAMLAVLGLAGAAAAFAASRGMLPWLSGRGGAAPVAPATDAGGDPARATARDATITAVSDAAAATAPVAQVGDAGGDGALAAATPPRVTLPEGPRPQWPTDQARASVLLGVQQQVYRCAAHAGRHGRTARVFVVYEGLTGRVLSLRFLSDYFVDSPIGHCVEQAVRDHPIAPFRAARWQTVYDLPVQ